MRSILLSLPLQLVFPAQIYNTVVLISTVKGFNVMAHGLYPRKKNWWQANRSLEW